MTGLRRATVLVAGLAAVLTIAACGSEDASPTVVTVTAESTEAAQAHSQGKSQEEAAGPAPTGANGEVLTGPGDNSGTGDGTGAQPTSGASPAPGQQSAEDAPGANSPDTTSDGQTVLTGTVVDMTTSEIMDISESSPGGPPPNGEPETNGYIVLKLDSPQEIMARHSGNGGQIAGRTASYVSLATPNGSSSSINWTSYVGKHVTVTTTAEDMWFPSDTGLPLGMARLTEGTVQ